MSTDTPKLYIQEIQDLMLRKNFQNLQDYFRTQNQFLNFQFFELSFDKAVTGFKKAHGLGTLPQDLIVSRITGAGYVTFKYGSFDETNIELDVSGPCRIRFFLGTFPDFVSSITNQSTDVQRAVGVAKQE